MNFESWFNKGSALIGASTEVARDGKYLDKAAACGPIAEQVSPVKQSRPEALGLTVLDIIGGDGDVLAALMEHGDISDSYTRERLSTLLSLFDMSNLTIAVNLAAQGDYDRFDSMIEHLQWNFDIHINSGGEVVGDCPGCSNKTVISDYDGTASAGGDVASGGFDMQYCGRNQWCIP